MKNDQSATQSQLACLMTRWSDLRRDTANPGFLDAYVICDASDRVLARIDQPRVKNLPTLRYAPPNPDTKNWTLFPMATAATACKTLDAQAPAFAPHRVLHVRDLVTEQVEAAERGLELLMHVEDPFLSEDVAGFKFG